MNEDILRRLIAVEKRLDDLLPRIERPVFVAYTPAWTCASTPPSLGAGTLTGQYIRRGNSCLVQVNLVAGADTTFGTGAWAFSLPVAVSASAETATGLAHLRDSGTNNYDRIVYLLASATTIGNFTQLDSATNVNTITNTVPFTWANGDSLTIQIEYRI